MPRQGRTGHPADSFLSGWRSRGRLLDFGRGLGAAALSAPEKSGVKSGATDCRCGL